MLCMSNFGAENDTNPQSNDRGFVSVCVVKEREKWEVCLCVVLAGYGYILTKK